MHKNLRRSVVALATAFASLAILTGPASATTAVHPTTITGGTLTAVSSGTFPSTYTRTLGGTAGTGCTTTSSATVDDAAQTIDVTAFSNIAHFILNGNHYVSTITRTGSSSGTYSGGSFTSVTIQLNIVIRAAANNSSTDLGCATTGGVLCTLRLASTTSPLAFSGTYTGTPSSAGSATFASSAGPAAISLGIGTCQVPFSTFNGGTATITLSGVF